ncbi:MAG: transcription antitermination factor NusB [Desulfovibrionales bacterium]|nr:transcription antitermination factor NusB [Desulfovibrionales bacterium]
MTQNRRHQRSFALQILYALNFDATQTQDSLRLSFAHFWDQENMDAQPWDSYAWTLVSGVFTHVNALDAVITQHSRHWKLARIAKVDVSILRLCLFEILYCPDIPLKVAMNEAIELAKDFGDDNSKTFINGILDAAAKNAEQHLA